MTLCECRCGCTREATIHEHADEPEGVERACGMCGICCALKKAAQVLQRTDHDLGMVTRAADRVWWHTHG